MEKICSHKCPALDRTQAAHLVQGGYRLEES